MSAASAAPLRFFTLTGHGHRNGGRFTEPGAPNGRFSSAMQILRDLALVDGDYEEGFALTPEGRDLAA